MLFKPKNESGPRIIISGAEDQRLPHPVHIRPRFKQSNTIFSSILFFLIVMIILLTFLIEIARKMPIHGISIDLPKVDGVTHVFENDTMLVTITQDGGIYFNERKFESIDKLKEVMDEKKDMLLQCDKNAPSELLFRIFAVTKELNVRVFMITKPEPESSKTVNFDDGKN